MRGVLAALALSLASGGFAYAGDLPSTLSFEDAAGAELASFQSTTAFARIGYGPADGGPVLLIRVSAAVGSENAVIDDFSFCAAQGGAGMPLADPIPRPIGTGAIRVGLTPVATGLTAPNYGVSPPGQSGQLLVTDQSGILWAIDLASKAKRVFLDVSARLVALGISGPGSFDERGLLGVAFHPDYASNGLFYTYTSAHRADVAALSTLRSV